MKRLFAISLCVVALFMTACQNNKDLSSQTGRTSSQIESPSSEQTISNEQSNVPAPLSEEELENMRVYAKSFAEFFHSPFSSPNDLDYEEIGRNSLFWLIMDFGDDYFEVNENGYPYIPKVLLQSYVREHFGIENYEYPVSENPNLLPQYNMEKDAYLFIAARGGINAMVSVVEESITDEIATYIIRFEFQNIETGEIMETTEMTYIFKIIPTDKGYSLRACSATIL